MSSSPPVILDKRVSLPERFGPYTLVRRLAVGGMGELFLAQRDGLAGFSKQLVVKRLRSELAEDRQFVDMFLTEGKVAALIDHPNVVHIYDLGEVGGRYYLAMEYIPGKDLGTVLEANGGPLELPLALHVMSCLCDALAFAHEAVSAEGQHLGLVHRDINPQNVLVSYSGNIALTDFGIAKVRAAVTGQAETRVGVLKGKFGYLSPEQACGRAVDRRTDIYALGLLLFELTTGGRAIPGDSTPELLAAAVDGLTRRPSEILRSYPRDLESIYLRATARRPEDRYQSAAELQEDLVTFQLEHRLVARSTRLGELMQRLFVASASGERPSVDAGGDRGTAPGGWDAKRRTGSAPGSDPARAGTPVPPPSGADRPAPRARFAAPAPPAAPAPLAALEGPGESGLEAEIADDAQTVLDPQLNSPDAGLKTIESVVDLGFEEPTEAAPAPRTAESADHAARALPGGLWPEATGDGPTEAERPAAAQGTGGADGLRAAMGLMVAGLGEGSAMERPGAGEMAAGSSEGPTVMERPPSSALGAGPSPSAVAGRPPELVVFGTDDAPTTMRPVRTAAVAPARGPAIAPSLSSTTSVPAIGRGRWPIVAVAVAVALAAAAFVVFFLVAR